MQSISQASDIIPCFSISFDYGITTYGVSNVIAYKGLSVYRGRRSPMMLRLQVWDEESLLGLFQRHRFEMQINPMRIHRLDQFSTPGDFGRGQGRQRMHWDLFRLAHRGRPRHLLHRHHEPMLLNLDQFGRANTHPLGGGDVISAVRERVEEGFAIHESNEERYGRGW